MDTPFRGTPAMYQSTRGLDSAANGSPWTTPGSTFAFQSWGNAEKILFFMMVDEVNSIFGSAPLQPNPVIGTNGFSSIVCKAGTTCTLNWTNYTIQSGNNRFLITG